MILKRLVPLALVTVLPQTVAAQQLPPELLPAAGARVRVVTRAGDRVSGTLSTTAGDTLVFIALRRDPLRRTELALPTDQVRELWVTRGRRRARGALYGLGIGFLAGAAAGAAIGYIGPADSECGDFPCGRGWNAAAGAIGGAILGAPVGTLLGAAHGPERWERPWASSR
jgi:hypothetical protein